MKARIISLLYILFCSFVANAQKAVEANSLVEQHIFMFDEIEQLEDPAGKLTLNDVLTHYNSSFKPSLRSTPQNDNRKSVYWYRIKLTWSAALNKRFLLEFYDQSIDDIKAFIPIAKDKYKVIEMGDAQKFDNRSFRHKNFEIELDKIPDGESIFYFRIQSEDGALVVIVLRSIHRFIAYALNEYLGFGIFYGMILIFSLYNLIMFLYVQQKQYLYYVIYILSVGLYETCIDGIAYQYLWPGSPAWNQVAYAVALCCMSVFALLFTQKLLHVKTKAPVLNKLINALILLRITAFFLIYFLDRELFQYKSIEVIPLTLAFYSGIYIYRKGYRPARFLVLGYSFLFFGFTLKFLIALGVNWLNFNVVAYYALTICFIIEMAFFSLSVGDQVHLLKKKKEKAQRATIRQMRANEKLKDSINKELETKVEERTREVFEKSAIIEQQYLQLRDTNELLKSQSEEISRMNALLKNDNQVLRVDIEKVTRARIMSTDVDFTEFSKIYPDKESCFEFLAQLKWSKGYACKKCGSSNYTSGHSSYSRRCSKCGYEESVMMNTIFQNTRIPINKSFYMIFLIYTSKGKISSHKLSEILEIRQNTCLAYSGKIKKLMDERKKELKNAGEMGWSKLVYEEN